MPTPLPPFSLGPIEGILGHWRGQGHDVAFLPGGIKIESDFIEETRIEPAGVLRITHELTVHAASYSSRLVHATTGEALHQEFGYWIWVPATQQIARTIAVGRCMGIAAVGQLDPASTPNLVRFTVEAKAGTTPPSIAVAGLGLGMPEMVDLTCAIQVDGGTFTYDQDTKVVFAPGSAPQDHTDRAVLLRQP